MRALNDAGNAGIYGGGAFGAGTTAVTMADVVTQNATLIGLGLTAFSIVIGIVFKSVAAWQDAKHKRVIQEQDAEYKRWLMAKKEPTE